VDGALQRLNWPARFEVIPGGPTIVLDAAHNDGSARALADTLRETFAKRRVRFVLGLMEDKDARAVLRPLLPLASAVEVTRAPGPRGLDARKLARLVGARRARVHEEPAEAIAAARADAKPNEVVCVTGSFALVGLARDVLGLPIAERLW
jgi:dihydrofolate synthase/folylpolyglutamate synthase